MSIEVNGKVLEWIENETIRELLDRMQYSFPLVTVKINHRIVPRTDFSEVVVPDGATIAVIHMMSGG